MEFGPFFSTHPVWRARRRALSSQYCLAHGFVTFIPFFFMNFYNFSLSTQSTAAVWSGLRVFFFASSFITIFSLSLNMTANTCVKKEYCFVIVRLGFAFIFTCRANAFRTSAPHSVFYPSLLFPFYNRPICFLTSSKEAYTWNKKTEHLK